MRRWIILLLLVASYTAAAHNRDTLAAGTQMSGAGRLALTENRGQWDERVRYCVQMSRAALFLEQRSMTVVVQEPAPEGVHFHHARGHRYHAYRMTFEGCRETVTPIGMAPRADYDNYYLGHDPSRWATHVQHFGQVVYQELYDGVDLWVYGTEETMKYDFVVAPGKHIEDIRITYTGCDMLTLRGGNLVVATSIGEVLEMRPYAYQVIRGDTMEVDCRYRVKGATVTFETGVYDATLPLVIDPTLHFSTYTGSVADNWGTTATYDSHKNTYTAGLVFSIGYPTSVGAYSDQYSGNADIGIFKFDTSGGQRLFATYLGGEHADMPHSMYVNNFNELLLMGTTGSSDFPTTADAFDTSFNGGTELAYLCFYNSEYYRNIYFPNGSDIFVSHFNEDGTALLASTFIGGSDNDGLNYRRRYNDNPITIMQGNDSLYYNYGDGARGELITDAMNNIYVGSTTMSRDFPTTADALRPFSGGGQDGVLLKLDHNLRNLLWSTYLGGSGDDAIYSIDCDAAYNVVACGGTNSEDFMPITQRALQPQYGGGSADGVVIRLSALGDELQGATYYGSEAYDQCYFVRFGSSDDIFLYGQTCAPGSSMIYNADYGTPNSGMLLARLSGDLTRREWSTVFGTPDSTPNLSPTAFATDICDRVYAVGWGRDFVNYNGVTWNSAGTWDMETTAGAVQTETDGQDFYIACLDAAATTLEYATFFGELHVESGDGGGDHVDGGTSRIDRLGTLYQSVCASCGGHNGFPTTAGAWSTVNGSNNCNNALFRINIHDDFPVAEFITPPAGCHPYQARFANTGRGIHFKWYFGDGDSSSQRQPIHTYAAPGEYTVQLIAYNAAGCRTTDTATAVVKVVGMHSNSSELQVCDGETVQIGQSPQPGCTYLWIGGDLSDNTIANPYVGETGQYVLLVTAESAGCSETDTFNVVFRQLIDRLTVTPPRCPGGSDGHANAISVAGGGGYSYQWDGVTGDDSVMHNLSDDGVLHMLTVSDGACTSRHLFHIDPLPRPTISHRHTSQICEDCIGEATIEVSSGSGRWQYLWDDGFDGNIRDSMCAGTYALSIVDSNGCTYRDSMALSVIVPTVALRAWADDTMLFVGASTHLHATGDATCNFSWQPESSLDAPYSANPLAHPEETTTYEVTRTDSTGCSYRATVTVRCTVIDCGETLLLIPNAFTPNDDGMNDQLCFRSENISQFHIDIFSRWGERVYSSDDVNSCWDGRHHGNLCLPGVYYYSCHIRCANNQENDLKGDITLVR